MKKFLTCVLAIALVGGFVFAGGGKESGSKRVKIGVALASQAQYRFKFDQKIMENKAAELGADIIFQYANYDATKQANQVENLISQGIDVLILNVVSGNMVNLVEKVRKEGIPVITFDNTVEGAQVELNVDRDNVKVGQLQLQSAIDFIGPKGGNVVLVKGDPGSAVAQRISKGYDMVAAKNANIKIVANQFHEAWSPEKALKTVENALSANHDNIQAFVCSADSVAMGIVPAIKAAKLDGKTFLCGMDVEVSAAKLINQGVMTMSIWTDIISGDQRTVEAAVKLAKGEKLVPDEIQKIGGFDIPVLLVDVVPITKTNLRKWLKEIAPEGWATEAEIFGN
ncbi:substrate-binding domain-containing protein [Treponema parvum]|uniref:Substrate-binding domain-containing protein n=1 Tax=Treponema parvum TaxID=138851 RepID=A0A975F416_9SPIR|nr:substrate-binding domain-containing protein [Treponema parvum]QTQ13863.1 substrate-binding domain-containing protein [Treponema parvum]